MLKRVSLEADGGLSVCSQRSRLHGDERVVLSLCSRSSRVLLDAHVTFKTFDLVRIFAAAASGLIAGVQISCDVAGRLSCFPAAGKLILLII